MPTMSFQDLMKSRQQPQRELAAKQRQVERNENLERQPQQKPETPAKQPVKRRQKTVCDQDSSFIQPQRPRSAGGFSDRLHREAEMMGTERERRRYLKELQELEACSFQPAINGNSERMMDRCGEYRPVHERAADIQQAKAARMAARRDDFLERTAPFTPTIGRRSAQLAARRADMEVTDRLADGSRPNAEAGRAEREARLAQAFTAQPTINPRSRQIAEEKPLYQKKTFVERQAQQEEERQKAIAAMRMSLGAMKEHSLTTGETQDELYRRLVDDAHHRRTALNGPKPKGTFAPEVNAKSRRLGKSTSLSELVNNTKVKAKREFRKQLKDVRDAAECTFQPRIGPRPASASRVRPRRYDIRDPEKLSATIRAEQDAKERRMMEAAEMREKKEVAECTFRPRIGKRPRSASSSSLVDVKGFGRFMELRDLAARRKEEVKPRPSSRSGRSSTGLPYTVPRPFRLSGAHPKAAKKWDALVEERRQSQFGECTFRPATGSARRARAVDRILDTDYKVGLDYDSEY